jgi:uroporphyrinogen decarboxylase
VTGKGQADDASRRSVIDSIDHASPSKVPIDFGGHRSSGIMAGAYRRLRQHLHLPARPIRVYDVVQQLAIIDDDVLDRFGVDTVELGRGFALRDDDWKPWRLPGGGDCLVPAWVDLRPDGDDWLLHSPTGRAVGVQRAGALYFDSTYWAYAGGVPDDLSGLRAAMADNLWATASPPGPAESAPDRLAAGAKRLRESTGRAILGLFGGNLMEWGQFLCRNDNFLMLLAGDPPAADRLLDALVEAHLGNLEAYLGAVGEHIDVIVFGDDLGMQTGPQISPEMYRRFFKPRHARLWRRAKQLADVRVNLHCCGGIEPLLDDLIDAGIDAINPVQTNCRGMDSRGLKERFGRRVCLWGGGCDTREVLPRGSAEDVRSHVLERLEVFAPGGGFVFQQVHNIMADVPAENVAAMFDAVAEFNGSR